MRSLQNSNLLGEHHLPGEHHFFKLVFINYTGKTGSGGPSRTPMHWQGLPGFSKTFVFINYMSSSENKGGCFRLPGNSKIYLRFAARPT